MVDQIQYKPLNTTDIITITFNWIPFKKQMGEILDLQTKFRKMTAWFIIETIIYFICYGWTAFGIGLSAPLACDHFDPSGLNINRYLFGMGIASIVTYFCITSLTFYCNCNDINVPRFVKTIYIFYNFFKICWFVLGGLVIFRSNMECISARESYAAYALCLWCVWCVEIVIVFWCFFLRKISFTGQLYGNDNDIISIYFNMDSFWIHFYNIFDLQKRYDASKIRIILEELVLFGCYGIAALAIEASAAAPCDKYDGCGLNINRYLLGLGITTITLHVSTLIECCMYKGSHEIKSDTSRVCYVLYILFKYCWFIIGGLVLFRSNMKCILDGNSYAIYALVLWCGWGLETIYNFYNYFLGNISLQIN